MRARVSVICERFIEAGWLLALVVAPLYFNVYSSRVFEPDKLAIVRSLATCMALAWLIKTVVDGLGNTRSRSRAAGQEEGERPLAGFASFVRIPLVLPTLILVTAYLLSTLLSVTPRISFWGSYQRLQGTYTMLSYIVIFALVLQNLRRRAQLIRLLNVAILTSLPIAFYGLLQHYDLDPLPWGGDVTTRVASNMGNAIFIAAYLIMIVPITLARVVQLQISALETADNKLRLGFGLAFWILFAVLLFAWFALGIGRGLAVGLLMIAALVLFALYLRRPIARFLLLGVLGLVLSVQLVCIVFSQSRGPILGLGVGLFLFILLYVFVRRWRAPALAVSGMAVAATVLLLLMNLSGSPLAAIRDVPYIGRLAQILEIEGGTGKVRVLIWEGAVQMLKARPLRTLVGYGPEAMYVAYNPYYPPDLAHYEARNASPDRSHNETFDALVMTGLLGFVAYMLLFVSLFYHGLGWLALIRQPAQRRLFMVCAGIGIGLGIAVPYLLDGSLRLVGVGLPLGLISGVVVYATASALGSMFGRTTRETLESENELAGADVLLLVALFAAVIGHFAEIHFGIAVAATRTYFWTFAALIVLVGTRTVSLRAVQSTDTSLTDAASGLLVGTSQADKQRSAKRRVKGRGDRSRAARRGGQGRRSVVTGHPSVDASFWAMAALSGLVLLTMFWDYTTNPLGQGNPVAVLLTSLTTMASKQLPDRISLGMLALFVVTGLVALLLTLASEAEDDVQPRGRTWWGGAALKFVVVAGGLSGVYALVHAGLLAPGVNLTNLVYEYYTALLVVAITLTIVLYAEVPVATAKGSARGTLVYAGAVLLLALFINAVNINIVRADILYKQGLRFDQQGMWDGAVSFYAQAADLDRDQDFYYLFLGRALMERAKQERDPGVSDLYFGRALETLQAARRLNPLNTDHTANMARLYRIWAEVTVDGRARQERLELAIREYEHATQLSPNNAQLWNEWAAAYVVVGEQDLALAKLQRSLDLDQQFTQTHLLLGDLRMARQEWPEAVSSYIKAAELDEGSVQAWSSLGYAYAQVGQLDQAIDANKRVLQIMPDDYRSLKNLALLYGEIGMPTEAIAFAERALTAAPQQEKASLLSFVDQQKGLIGGGNR